MNENELEKIEGEVLQAFTYWQEARIKRAFSILYPEANLEKLTQSEIQAMMKAKKMGIFQTPGGEVKIGLANNNGTLQKVIEDISFKVFESKMLKIAKENEKFDQD